MSTPTHSIATRGIEGASTGRTDATPTGGTDAAGTALLAGGSR